MELFDGVGTFCVEMFVTKEGKVLVNEVAPRVHNSGHYTIEACSTSQFKNHVRAIVGLSPASPEMVAPAAVMKNLVGNFNGAKRALKMKDTSVHIYDKTECKPGRKMGHITMLGHEDDLEKRLKKLDKSAEKCQ